MSRVTEREICPRCGGVEGSFGRKFPEKVEPDAEVGSC